MAMSLTTPQSVRTLQRKLYLKAKAEPDYRFYLRYDKIYRADVLRHAYELVRANRGAPGVDGVTCQAIEAAGLENWLAGLAGDLRTKAYQPQPVRRVMIPKPGGDGERPLGIPTIRDRVAQTAAKLVLEPIFEADLEPTAYGYRPGRSGTDAVKAVHRLLCQGFTERWWTPTCRSTSTRSRTPSCFARSRRGSSIVTCWACSNCGSRHRSRRGIRTGGGA